MCPGYRDLGALVFRNETSRVVQKARQIYSETTEDTQPGLERQIEPYMSSIPGSILTSRKDQAIGVFFDQYATDVEGCYDYVRSVCSQPVCRGLLILYDTIELIGLAYIYGTRYGRPCRSAMELDVYRKHSAVLHAVNDALGIGSIATRDEIIVSVLLLGLFEVCLRSPNVMIIFLTQYRRAGCHMHGTKVLLFLARPHPRSDCPCQSPWAKAV